MSTSEQQQSDQSANDPNASHQLIVIQKAQQELIQQVLGSVGTTSLHNFPGTKAAQWKMIALAESGASKSADDIGDEPFAIKYFYAHQIQIVNRQTGEIAEPVRVVLIAADNSSVQFVSDGIAKSLARILQTFGMGPYDPPIMVRLQVIRTNRGFKTYTMIPA